MAATQRSPAGWERATRWSCSSKQEGEKAMMTMTAMRAAALTAATLAIPALALASDGTFDKTLSVNGSVQLEVSTGSGYVHVNPGSDNQVHIIGHVHSNHGWMGGSSE